MMFILPILPIYPQKNPPRHTRAIVAVKQGKHTVIDSETGKSAEMDPVTAWKEHERLNGIVV